MDCAAANAAPTSSSTLPVRAAANLDGCAAAPWPAKRSAAPVIGAMKPTTHRVPTADASRSSTVTTMSQLDASVASAHRWPPVHCAGRSNPATSPPPSGLAARTAHAGCGHFPARVVDERGPSSAGPPRANLSAATAVDDASPAPAAAAHAWSRAGSLKARSVTPAIRSTRSRFGPAPIAALPNASITTGCASTVLSASSFSTCSRIPAGICTPTWSRSSTPWSLVSRSRLWHGWNAHPPPRY